MDVLSLAADCSIHTRWQAVEKLLTEIGPRQPEQSSAEGTVCSLLLAEVYLYSGRRMQAREVLEKHKSEPSTSIAARICGVFCDFADGVPVLTTLRPLLRETALDQASLQPGGPSDAVGAASTLLCRWACMLFWKLPHFALSVPLHDEHASLKAALAEKLEKARWLNESVRAHAQFALAHLLLATAPLSAPERNVSVQDAFILCWLSQRSVSAAISAPGLPNFISSGQVESVHFARSEYLRQSGRALMRSIVSKFGTYMDETVVQMDRRDLCRVHFVEARRRLQTLDVSGAEEMMRACDAQCEYHHRGYLSQWLLVGLTLLCRKQYGACCKLCKAMMAEFTDIRLTLLRARAEYLAGNVRVTVQMCRMMLDRLRDPSDLRSVRVAGLLVQQLVDCRLVAEAEQLSSRCIHWWPDDAEGFALRGVVYRAEDNSRAALEFFRRALIKDPWHARSNTELASIFAAADHTVLATYHAVSAIRKCPYLSQPWAVLGKCLQKQRRFREAARCYATAVKIDERYPFGWSIDAFFDADT